MRTQHVLVAINDPDLSGTVAAALEQAGLRSARASSIEDAMARLADRMPLVVVIGTDLPDDGHDRLIAQVRSLDQRRQRTTPVLSLGTDSSVDARIAALRAGADDSIWTPVYPAELGARVHGMVVRFHGAQALAAPNLKGRVLAFYGARGGVGTTTVAINTAVSLAIRQKHSVVLVDGNLRLGDHRVFLNLSNERSGILDLVNAAEIDAELVQRVLTHHEAGVDVLLAPVTPEEADLITPDLVDATFAVLRTLFDEVVVDLDRGFSEASLRVLDVADRIIVVLAPDLVSLKNARLLLSTMDRLGYESEKVQLLLNRGTAVSGLDEASVDRVAVRPIAYRLPNDYKAALAALNAGTPFLGPETPLGKAIAAFTDSIVLGADETTRAALGRMSQGGFLRGLRRRGGTAP
jgi:pilus assembly protein CpaE